MKTFFFCFAAIAWLSSNAVAQQVPQMVQIGVHPASTQTAYPAILNLVPYQGRIYMGYGDYNFYPAQVITSYDPSDRRFHMEHAAGTDAVDTMRVINDTLYVPHVDPIHYEDFQDYSWKSGGVWREAAPMGAFHFYDMCSTGGGALYFSGSDWQAGALLARSDDGGRTWTAAVRTSASSRFYWCCALNGSVFCQRGIYNPTTNVLTAAGGLSNISFLRKAQTVTVAGYTFPFFI